MKEPQSSILLYEVFYAHIKWEIHNYWVMSVLFLVLSENLNFRVGILSLFFIIFLKQIKKVKKKWLFEKLTYTQKN